MTPRPSAAVMAVGKQESTWLRQLRGELDWIVLKAMAKEQEHRYVSAAELAADVQRYLQQEPVLAGPPSASYRLKKFVKRHRVPVGAAVAVLVTAVAGALVSWRWAQEADANALVATRRASDLERVASFQATQLEAVDPHAMGVVFRQHLLAALPAMSRDEIELRLASLNFTELASLVLRKQLVDPSLAAIEQSLSGQPLLQARLLRTMAATLRTLGSLSGAIDAQQRAVTMLLAEHDVDEVILRLATVELAELLHRAGRDDEAEPMLLPLVALIPCGDLAETQVVVQAGCLLADIALIEGRVVEAEQLARRSVQAAEALAAAPELRAQAANVLGIILRRAVRIDEAERCFRSAWAFLEGASATASDGALVANNLAQLLTDAERFDEAERWLRDAWQVLRERLGESHPDTMMLRTALGSLLFVSGRRGAAETELRANLAAERAALGDLHPQTVATVLALAEVWHASEDNASVEKLLRPLWQNSRHLRRGPSMASCSLAMRLASAVEYQGRFEEALALLQPAVVELATLLPSDDVQLLSAQTNLDSLQMRLGRYEEVVPRLQQAEARLRSAFGAKHLERLKVLGHLGYALLNLRRLNEAEAPLAEALALREERHGRSAPETLISLQNVGVLRTAQGRAAEAEALHREVLEERRRTLPKDSSLIREASHNLGRALLAQGKLDECEPLLREFAEQTRHALGADDLLTMIGERDLGLVWLLLGRFEDAQPLVQGLFSRRNPAVMNHPETVTLLMQQVMELDRRGRLREMESVLLDAIGLLRRIGWESQPQYRTCLYNLSYALMVQGRWQDAEPWALETVASSLAIYGSSAEHTWVAHSNLGVVREKLGRMDEALASYRDAVVLARAAEKADQSSALSILARWGSLLVANARFAEARTVMEPQAEVAERVLPGYDSARWGMFLAALTTARAALAPAEQLVGLEARLLDAHDLIASVRGPDHAETRQVEAALVRLYERWDLLLPGQGHAERAAKWRQ